ncbi:MAG: hypothetical protein ACW98X_23375 [Promethearchaeota archaeon]|jgi:hypothetical protein
MKKGIGTRKQKKAAKKSIKAYAGQKGKASKYVMKQKDSTTKFGYARGKAKTGKYKKQKPTTKVGRKSLKK